MILVEQALPSKKVLGRARQVRVTGRQSWNNADEAALVGFSTSSTMTWTLTLTRR